MLKKQLEEFKTFAMRGNVIDLAVGVIIGGAFGKITTSLVNDIIMPLLGITLGGVKFSQLSYVLKEAEGTQGPIVLSYGNFIQTAIDFLIISFSIFLFVKLINKLKRKQADNPVAPNRQEILLQEIRDLIAKRM